jgi:hypothetical protein
MLIYGLEEIRDRQIEYHASMDGGENIARR